jgi:Ca2+-binding EF-hand superfamily protein
VILLQPFFTERVFQIFDKDNSGAISLQEFIDAMHQFAGQSPDDKIRFLFKVYDIDGKITMICVVISKVMYLTYL